MSKEPPLSIIIKQYVEARKRANSAAEYAKQVLGELKPRVLSEIQPAIDEINRKSLNELEITDYDLSFINETRLLIVIKNLKRVEIDESWLSDVETDIAKALGPNSQFLIKCEISSFEPNQKPDLG